MGGSSGAGERQRPPRLLRSLRLAQAPPIRALVPGAAASPLPVRGGPHRPQAPAAPRAAVESAPAPAPPRCRAAALGGGGRMAAAAGEVSGAELPGGCRGADSGNVSQSHSSASGLGEPDDEDALEASLSATAAAYSAYLLADRSLFSEEVRGRAASACRAPRGQGASPGAARPRPRRRVCGAGSEAAPGGRVGRGRRCRGGRRCGFVPVHPCVRWHLR